MSHRTVSWTRIDRAGRDARTTIPAGMLGARALIQFSARTRPLATAGRYDRAAIMAAACAAVSGIMERCGVSRREAMSSALKAAWQVAKAAYLAVAH
ncbi:hypothetical protein GOFOIKOB_6495 [Methylobacterium tardum]|uniref:Uncharacterized protein n=1 Tax=Methylobacterium tardum TaxID=374432 RepID=A0AA37TLU5_9HYPH|nr:hypothetical protein [Methylobacterium tardum]URD35216.1 hypothetical protein M6G65_22180 [Methylobacterium tardum]GJE53416.1 hypothetical protein GOFOIKOB_6495 [Methylobacterium tardum]GLS70383.1 hypothetical protein GCM10007890_23960 [Methylobacterium tardum]